VNLRIRAVIRKELREFRRNKFVIGSMIVLPLMLLVLPVGTLLSIKPGTPLGAVRAAVNGENVTLFLIPLLLPTIIAGYAVIGEREQGTLEPVLTTPVRDEELLLGKALSAILPTVAIAYVLFGAYVTAIRLGATSAVVSLVWKAPLFVSVVLFAPLLATFAIWVGLAMSTRATDVRVASQLSALAVLPLLGLIALFTFGVVSPSVGLEVAVAALLVAIDVGAWRVVSSMFNRERLLTRYGRS
jgi:ABC-2 type transport system permease protein